MFIQVVQDIVCPWCRIGHRNLDTAIARWVAQGHDTPEVQWFPYQLDPIAPNANENFVDRFTQRKGIPAAQVAQMHERVNQAGAAAGVTFRFDRIELAQNTLLAHQLIALVPANQQSAVVEALHDAYFEQGRNVEQVDVLLAAARAAGVDEALLPGIEADLRAQIRLDDVQAMIGQAQTAGITGVPFFIIDGKLALSGAQPPEVLLQAMEQAAAQPAPAPAG